MHLQPVRSLPLLRLLAPNLSMVTTMLSTACHTSSRLFPMGIPSRKLHMSGDLTSHRVDI